MAIIKKFRIKSFKKKSSIIEFDDLTLSYGNRVILDGINFKIIGVYRDPGGEDEESQLYIPITTAQKSFNGGDRINNMSYTINMPENFDKGVELSQNIALAIETDLKQMQMVAPNDIGAIRVNNNLEEAQRYYSLIDAIKLIFWFFVCLYFYFFFDLDHSQMVYYYFYCLNPI